MTKSVKKSAVYTYRPTGFKIRVLNVDTTWGLVDVVNVEMNRGKLQRVPGTLRTIQIDTIRRWYV